MNRTKKIIARGFVVLAAIALLGGCDMLKKGVSEKKQVSAPAEVKEGIVLLSIDNEPAITDVDFNKNLSQMLQVNPYFRGASADSLPKALKRKFFDELIKQELIVAWAEKQNIAKDAEFEKAYQEMINLVKRSLLVQRFETKMFEEIKVSDSEVKDYFEKNKDKFVKEQGGVTVEGVKFDNDVKAVDFYAKAKANMSNFKKLATTEDKEKYKNFGRVDENQQAAVSIPKEIKTKILSLTKFPAVEKITSGKDIWVVYFSDKKNTVYLNFDEVKEQLEAMIKNNKFREIVNKKIDELRSQFTLNVNEDYFKEVETEPSVSDESEGINVSMPESKEVVYPEEQPLLDDQIDEEEISVSTVA